MLIEDGTVMTWSTGVRATRYKKKWALVNIFKTQYASKSAMTMEKVTRHFWCMTTLLRWLLRQSTKMKIVTSKRYDRLPGCHQLCQSAYVKTGKEGCSRLKGAYQCFSMPVRPIQAIVARDKLIIIFKANIGL